MSVLIIPGIGNSGPDHWQTLWESADPSLVRIQVKDWEHPTCACWVEAIDTQARVAGESLVVAAHSVGCLAFAHWAARSRRRILVLCWWQSLIPAGPISQSKPTDSRRFQCRDCPAELPLYSAWMILMEIQSMRGNAQRMGRYSCGHWPGWAHQRCQ
jgi:predicted alpha/beta hydrolase family esterase